MTTKLTVEKTAPNITKSFIETRFPVSKESYKKRMANNGQTLTALGKW